MFNHEFSEGWSQILTTYPSNRTLLLGDFNIPVNSTSNSDVSAFLDIIDSFNCNQHVTFPTHESGNTLDLCITQKYSDLTISHLSADYYISDHTFIGFYVNIHRPPHEKISIQSRAINKISMDDFRKDLHQASNRLIQAENEDLVTCYNDELKTILDKHAPLRVKTVLNDRKIAWFDVKAKELKAEVRRLDKILKRQNSSNALGEFKRARSLYRNHLKMSKMAHIKEAVESAKGDPKCLFNITMTLMGKQSRNPLPEALNDESLAEEFANFFIGKIQTIRDSLEDIPKYTPVGRSTQELTSLTPMDETQVLKLLSQAKPTT